MNAYHVEGQAYVCVCLCVRMLQFLKITCELSQWDMGSVHVEYLICTPLIRNREMSIFVHKKSYPEFVDLGRVGEMRYDHIYQRQNFNDRRITGKIASLSDISVEQMRVDWSVIKIY